MASKAIYWLKGLDVEEVSLVDKPANQSPFRFFKRHAALPAHVRKQEDEGAGEETALDNGVTLYPWGQAVADMAAQFSKDDAPRIAALMLAKYGEGPNAEIKKPLSGMDPMSAARAAIDEGKKLMSQNPLLRPDGNEKEATAMKSALVAGLEEFATKHGLIRRRAKVKKEAAAVALEDPVLAELKTLNGYLASLTTPSAPAKGKPAKAKTPEPDEEEEMDHLTAAAAEEAEEDDEAEAEDEGDDDASEGDAPEASAFEKAAIAKLTQIGEAVAGLAGRVEALEKAPRSRGVSKAQHAVQPAGTVSAKPEKYTSTMGGCEWDIERVEPFLKRATTKGDEATKH